MRQSYELPPDDGSRRSRCPPSLQEMASTPHYAQASARAPRPSPPSTHPSVSPVTVSPYHQPGSTTPRDAPQAPRPARADPPKYGEPPGRAIGFMAPSPMSSRASTPSYSPHSSVSFTSMRGEYTPTVRTPPPSDEATRSSRLMSSARSSRQLNPAAIAEWAARASTDEVLEYWHATASPHERDLCLTENAGPPHPNRSPRAILIANAQCYDRYAQWVRSYLAMSAPPSQPRHQMGGSPGPMAPSPLNHEVKSPSTGMAFTPLPARLVKTSTSPQCVQSSSPPSPPLFKRGGASLAEHRAATVLQCWKRRLWLRRWFDQQARSKERRLRLQALCRGASTYARLVGVNRRPPPIPTIKPSDPMESIHPFRTRGQPLPPRKRARRPTRKRRRPGRRHRPRAPDSRGGGQCLCLPICFWAAQTAVAAAVLPLGSGRAELSPYLPPHKAATAIQHVYRSYLRVKPLRQELADRALSHEVYMLERNMVHAMRDLRDSDHYVYSVSSTAGGGTKWTAHRARAAAPTLFQELMRSIELQLQDMDMRHWAAGW